MKRLLILLILFIPSWVMAQQTPVASDTLKNSPCASSCGNGGTLGANWTQNSGLNLVESTNGVDGGGNSNGYSYLNLAYWSGAGSFGNDMYSQVTCSNIGVTVASRQCGVGVRMTGTLSSQANATGYLFYALSDGNGANTATYYLYKSVGGVTTQIDVTGDISIANPVVLNLQVVGSVLTAKSGSTTIFTDTDSGIASGGKPGITVRLSGTSYEYTWSGGTVSSARHKVVVTGN